MVFCFLICLSARDACLQTPGPEWCFHYTWGFSCPPNHKATCDQGHIVFVSAMGCSTLVSVWGIKKYRQQQRDHLFSQRCGDKRRLLGFSASHIGNGNHLTFMSIFVKDLAAVGEGSCKALIGKRESIPHSSKICEC